MWIFRPQLVPVYIQPKPYLPAAPASPTTTNEAAVSTSATAGGKGCEINLYFGRSS